MSKKTKYRPPTRVTLGQKLAQQAGAPVPVTNKHLVTDKATLDSFSNLTAKLGIQQPDSNLISNSYYELGPFISRNRLELEAMYRSSWIVGQLVDTVAEDMTKEGISMYSEMSPDDVADFQAMISEFQIWHDICSTIKWGRLYGGAIAVMLIDGADYSKPLDIERIRKDQFKGLVVLDRWMIQPSMGELITDICKDIGKPKYYEVLSGVSTFPEQRIHYTRVMRFDGIELPYYQSLFENLWGISVIERMFDRLVAFDSATVGAAQLVYKAHLRVIMIDKFREALASGDAQEAAVIKNIEYIRALQTSEGITALDGADKFETHNYNFSGLSDMLQQFGQQISGATGIPLVRLFGQSPAGLSSTGESDLRNYYDHINKEQQNKIRPQLEKLFAVMAKSRFGRALPEDFNFEFVPLWQLSESEKSTIASQDTNQVAAAFGGGLYTKALSLKELKQQSRITGRGTNITEEDIENAKKEEEAPDFASMFAGESGGAVESNEAQQPEDENERLGGQDPDLAENEKVEKPKIEKEVKDSVKKMRFRDKLRKIYLILKDGNLTNDKGDFVETEHPRENDGKFTEKAGGKSGSKALVAAKIKNGKISPVKGDKMPGHISKLRIPPAWTDVRYNPDPKAELLVVGKDAKNRVQYIYSEQHWKKAEKSKFDRIKVLEKKFDKIKSENDKKIAKKTEEAIVLKLIMETGIRPGGEEDTGAKVKAYGATTLEGRHVETDKKGNVTLHFIGKKGVENKIPLQNPEVAKIIIERAKKAGTKGRLFNTDGISLLKYTSTLGGGGFKTKDFRTLIGTKTAMELVGSMKAPSTEKEYKKQVKEVAKTVASKLGNTPAVALKSYISPVVFSEWRIS